MKILTITKNILVKHTAVGKRINAGIGSAKEAINIQMEKIAKHDGDFFQKAKEKIEKRGFQATFNLTKDKEFLSTISRFNNKKLSNGCVIDKSSTSKLIQSAIENLGVGATKFSQIISCEPGMMEKIEKKFGSKVAEAIKNTKSGCIPTRTVEEAQDVLTKAFPKEGFKIEKQLGVASVGETYLVKRADGTQAVCKMIKKGVDNEQLVLEEKIFQKITKELTDSSEEYKIISKQLKNLYKDWSEELNLVLEAKNNKLLQEGAKRYKVANVTDVAQDGSCLIMDKAGGIKMDDLLKVLKDYIVNPDISNFKTKYAKEIAENTWLSNPEKVIKEMQTSLLKAFDEQFLFIKKDGKTIMHGDPHTGNFFITTDNKGNLIPEFIDTGSCVTRNAKQIKDDINFFANYFFGNSKGVAEYYLKQCNYKGEDTAKILEKLTKDIKEQIFGKKQDIRDFNCVQSNLNAIIEKHGLKLSPEHTTSLKAQGQFLTAIMESATVANANLDIMTLIKDIPRACWCMLKNGENPVKAIKEPLKHAYYNQEQATATAYQFTIKEHHV